MDSLEKHGTPQKALLINLDPTVFGSFAEIGAGQEVARWFLRVGGASGTVAKTISAYDKEVSDDLYGAGTRYVSKPRLLAMLESEWEQLLGQLDATRGATTKFFSFVDTISARNYSGTNDCHGWVGLRFMQQPGGPANDVILHVNLRDPSNVQQQEAVGILGVNLLYAAEHDLKSPEEFLGGVMEDLSQERMELDCVELKGPAFENWDRDELHAHLVADGHAEAVVFPADNHFVPPNELLYKRALVLAPGWFGNVNQLHVDLIRTTLRELPTEELKESKGGLGLFCLSTAPRTTELKALAATEIVKTVKTLQEQGYGVMLFRSPELYGMSAFVNRYTGLRIHFAIGLSILVRVLGDPYLNLPGQLLEAIARLFSQNVRVVVHPMEVEEVERRVKTSGLVGWSWEATNGLVYANDLHPAKPLDYLYKYLLGESWILPSKRALG
jgi:hypothetical protein